MNDNQKTILLRLSGDEISPTNVRIDTLFQVLAGLEQVIIAMAGEMGLQFDEHEAIIIPGPLSASSLGVEAHLNQDALAPLNAIDEAFHNDRLPSLPDEVHEGFRKIQRGIKGRDLHLDIQSEALSLNGFSITAVEPQFASDTMTDEITSHAVVYGTCMRVNRERRDATIQLHNGQKCTLKSLEDHQIRELLRGAGQDLNQTFRVDGQATWSLTDYQIKDIHAESIEAVERNVRELFSGLRETADESVDDLDPILYVNELRGK